MIAALLRVYAIQLRRDRAVQILAFVVPIAFFSIFATIFGGPGGRLATPRPGVGVVDRSQTPVSRALVGALAGDPALRVTTRWQPDAGRPGRPLTAALAESLVRAGDLEAALVLPPGLDTSLMRADGRGVPVTLLEDPSDPVAGQMTAGLLEGAALRAGASPGRGARAPVPARLDERRVPGGRPENPMIAFYAAGIAVMFVMFSAAGGAGALIEETEAGTLERVLTSGPGMSGLLAARWLYLALLGCAQLTVMFVWGALAFRLPLAAHVTGFAIMTVATSACAAAFGLVLGTAARTRQQLQGVANLVVLSLSAIGGSMFPRFLMSATLQKLSLVGFNAWALDGFRKVFWRDAPVAALAPQLAALAGFTALFLLLARRFARRWEAV